MKISLITNAWITDGSGGDSYFGEIALSEGRIRSVRRLDPRAAEPRNSVESEGVLDAKGMTVTPGFVDIHRHHDLAALFDPAFGELELAQGITSVVGGNCGLGAFPNQPAYHEAQASYIEPCLGRLPEGCRIRSFGEYYDALLAKERAGELALHTGALVGAGAVAAATMGYERRPFTQAERERAVSLLEEGLEAGGLGLSFGLMYEPECYLAREDLLALAKKCAQYDRLVTCHMRGEGDSLCESVEEIIGICREAGARLNISHFKVTGRRNWGHLLGRAIDLIEAARAEGFLVTVDAYPYPAGATTALSLIPPAVLAGGRGLEYLGTKEGVRALKDSIYSRIDGWDNMVESIGFESVIIGGVSLEEDRIYTGLSIAEAAEKAGFSEPCEFFGPFVAREQGKIGVILMSMAKEDVERVLTLPYCCLISDGLYGGGDSPHPRLYGAFPKFLRTFVQENKLLSLEEAVYKMTLVPAERLGLAGRGLIREGYAADLNIFDPAAIEDRASFTSPKELSRGIAYTLIQGEIACMNSKTASEKHGTLLKK